MVVEREVGRPLEEMKGYNKDTDTVIKEAPQEKCLVGPLWVCNLK